MPLEGYVSLDSQGEFGAVAMTDDVKRLLFEGMTEDYVIYYYPESKAITYDSSDNSIEKAKAVQEAEFVITLP